MSNPNLVKTKSQMADGKKINMENIMILVISLYRRREEI